MNLFINLPISKISTAKTKVFPLSILSLIAYLREHHVIFDLFDMTIRSENELLKYLSNNRSAIIGISIMIAAQMNYAISLFDKIKFILPHSVIIVGGTHVSQFSDEIYKNCQDVDYIIVGEGEEKMLQIINYLSSGGTDRMILRDDKFIGAEEILMPAYDILNFEEYRSDISGWHNPYNIDLGIRVPIFTSRGCPYNCNFCSVSTIMGNKYRPMSAIVVVDMIEWLNSRGIVYFAIYDANFSQQVNRVIDICNEIKKRNLEIYLDIPAGLPVGISTVEMIDALAEAGLIRTKIAVENIDDYIRNKVMHKKTSYDQICKSIEIIRKYKQIFVIADFILGMPEETHETLDKMIDFARDLEVDDIGINIATPYPGTQLWRQCVNDNLFTIDPSELWKDEAYTHTNIDRFTIKPYALKLDDLFIYRDRLIEIKNQKCLRK